MKTATVADLRNRFPSVYRWIEEGESVELTKRGRVVAHLVPAPTVKIGKPGKFKMPDFAALSREVFGDNPPVFSPEDSAFIHDRGDR